ncbi:chromate resistance protein ChrB domain-containing protein [Dyadobacter frigoris]|uniref:Chromate resistance protein n=1 Tax=Dyadobacter frigoris TaxID=2576211 RepID=A0A4U6CW90_9BACT|nr:chromate resistance protein ChrB domain-containing protein [Dyadobacter frigoris]TKT88015.1 chromate resistance protein [Dyadobacter frigoris]GLU52913.1 hypothetical protein Dfri01_23740 [Dyadobacter frigoris]
MKCITRERPKIDRIACPWLVKNFVDPEAIFYYVPKDQVFDKASEPDAIPYHIDGAEYSHYGDQCSFDYIVARHKITDPAIHQLAIIVRAADTDRFEMAPQAAGLWAISAGLSHTISDDHQMLEVGLKVYDALYARAKYLQKEKHVWKP